MQSTLSSVSLSDHPLPPLPPPLFSITTDGAGAAAVKKKNKAHGTNRW